MRSLARCKILMWGMGTAFLMLAAPTQAVPECEWLTQARFLMGTLWTLEAHGPEMAAALDEAFKEIRRLDEALSTYIGSSELSRVNREAGRMWSPVSPETAGLLERAFDHARSSEGAFDPTVGPRVKIWGFKHLDYRVPEPDRLEAARRQVGWSSVSLSHRRGVRFLRPGMELDLGAIAKGYGVDRALAVLRSRGATSARVDAGGNQGVFGASPGGGAWRFGVKHPRLDGETLGIVDLPRGGISTSGDYERGFWQDGVRYGHILDPRTGCPVRGMLSVTVVAPDAETADALSTALYVLGVIRGERLLRRHPGCHALFVLAGEASGSFTCHVTPGFRWHAMSVGGRMPHRLSVVPSVAILRP